MTKLEDRIRTGLHQTAQRIPETTPVVLRIGARQRRPVKVWIGVVAVAAVLALFTPLLFLVDGVPTDEPENAVDPLADAELERPIDLERFSTVVEVEETSELIGVERGHAFKSSDGGESWTEIIVPGGADVLDLSLDGTILAVTNSGEWTADLGPESRVQGTPKAHVYDAVVGAWETTELPRPALPVDDPRPSPSGSSADCGLEGIEWRLDALSVAIGESLVILGEQRITEENLCDESYQLFWASENGETWTITEPTGVPGYMIGITWFADRYIAYGSDGPWHRFERSRSIGVWSSNDLRTWDAADLDTSVLSENTSIWVVPEGRVSGPQKSVIPTVADGRLRLEVPVFVLLDKPGLDASINDIDELRQWAAANGRDPSQIEEALEFLDLEFPLGERDVETLVNLVGSASSMGRLLLETEDGVTWTSRYEAR